METKDYIELICKNCKNDKICNKNYITNKIDINIKVMSCDNYSTNNKKRRKIIYKNKIFFY